LCSESRDLNGKSEKMKINCKLKAQASEITIAVTIIVEVAANN
jgi:hypothetical protein